MKKLDIFYNDSSMKKLDIFYNDSSMKKLDILYNDSSMKKLDILCGIALEAYMFSKNSNSQPYTSTLEWTLAVSHHLMTRHVQTTRFLPYLL